MASVFDYKFNVGGNFTTAMDGMAESTGRFNAALEQSSRGFAKWEQKFAVFGLARGFHLSEKNALRSKFRLNSSVSLTLASERSFCLKC